MTIEIVSSFAAESALTGATLSPMRDELTLPMRCNSRRCGSRTLCIL